MYDRGEHGFSQRLRLGVDARLGDDTNLRLLGSASGSAAVDTAETVPLSEGLQHQRVEEADLTHRVSQWDFSIGRLTEPMGVTGYWFGKEFDGVRAVWTGKDARSAWDTGPLSTVRVSPIRLIPIRRTPSSIGRRRYRS